MADFFAEESAPDVADASKHCRACSKEHDYRRTIQTSRIPNAVLMAGARSSGIAARAESAHAHAEQAVATERGNLRVHTLVAVGPLQLQRGGLGAHRDQVDEPFLPRERPAELWDRMPREPPTREARQPRRRSPRERSVFRAWRTRFSPMRSTKLGSGGLGSRDSGSATTVAFAHSRVRYRVGANGDLLPQDGGQPLSISSARPRQRRGRRGAVGRRIVERLRHLGIATGTAGTDGFGSRHLSTGIDGFRLDLRNRQSPDGGRAPAIGIHALGGQIGCRRRRGGLGWRAFSDGGGRRPGKRSGVRPAAARRCRSFRRDRNSGGLAVADGPRCGVRIARGGTVRQDRIRSDWSSRSRVRFREGWRHTLRAWARRNR